MFSYLWSFCKIVLKVLSFGSGAILPGISSGVFCVILGIYEKLLNSILSFFKDVKSHFKFLFPILLGGIIGFVLFGNILSYFFFSFPIQTKSIFIGFILGSIPLLLKKINETEKFKPLHLVFFLLTLLIGIASILLEKNQYISTFENINFLYLIFCGFLMSIRNCCTWC